MIICPICEHQQAQGTECDVCGKKLVAAAPVAVAVAPMPDMETTHVAGGRAPVAVSAIADLELTRQQAVGAVAVQPVSDLDTGRSAPVGNIVSSPVDDMDTGRALSDGHRTAAPTGPAICRYCRTPQESGLVCDRCGMRLIKMRTPPPAQAQGEALVPSGEWTKCTKCHTNARAGRACVSCGTPVPAAG
ncbi:hypothetical protein [Melittangium boletus]|uniref:hypothetical protein n=1 Tax=Melittangium boletus TaxID=83453 RepID=UPI003DA5DF23